MVANTGHHTFARRNSKTHIDVTLYTPGLPREPPKWTACFENVYTQHAHIYTTIRITGAARRADQKKSRPALNVREFVNHLQECAGAEDLYGMVLNRFRRSQNRGHGPTHGRPYWWSEEVETLRSESLAARRRLTRARARHMGQEVIEALEGVLKEAKSELRRGIRKMKIKCWNQLLAQLEEDMWGQGYAIAVKTLQVETLPYVLTKKRVREILRVLFPTSRVPPSILPEIIQPGSPFTQEELKEAVAGIKPKSAPGPDGLTAVAVKIMSQTLPDETLAMYNCLLAAQRFPENWKTSRVVLILKKGKDPADPSSFRPICLLNDTAKLYERLLARRIIDEAEDLGALSDTQCGFRRGKSTVTALKMVLQAVKEGSHSWCALVMIDIKNAFNSAPWHKIIEAMVRRGFSPYLIHTVADYLKDRQIELGSGHFHSCSAGVPQGSVLGPILWNIYYDEILRLHYPPGVIPVAYADDLTLVVRAGEVNDLKDKINRSFETAEDWASAAGLRFAAQKTEIVVVRRPGRMRMGEISLAGVRISPKRSAVCLGVVIDEKLSFGAHVQAVVGKAKERLTALQRLMPNVRGPGSRSRLLYSGVVHSILLYAAPVWKEAIKWEKYRTILLSAQRTILLRVASAYRTVSAEAVHVVAGVPPVDLLVKERAYLDTVCRDGRNRTRGVIRQARAYTIRRWQDQWSRETGRAAWTRRLVPDLAAWYSCGFRRSSYWVTQFLTGHGSFGTFTYRIGKSDTDICSACQTQDSPEHVAYHCKRWEAERRAAVRALKTDLPSPELFLAFIIDSEENFNGMYDFITEVMKRKEKEDRDNQTAVAAGLQNGVRDSS